MEKENVLSEKKKYEEGKQGIILEKENILFGKEDERRRKRRKISRKRKIVADVACSVHRPGVFLYDNRLRQKKEFENSDKFSGMYICVKLVKSLAGRSRNIVCSVFVAEEIWRFDCSQTQINLVSDNFTAICDQVIT